MPYILPLNHSIPVYKIIAKVIRQDMSRVALPVILNEPLNALQRSVEILYPENIVNAITEKDLPDNIPDTPKASTKRLILCGLL